MEQNSFLDNLRETDPSWTVAQELVDKHLHIGPNLWTFFRSSWNGHLSARDLIKMLGFSRLNVFSLLVAADLDGEEGEPDITFVEQSIGLIGIRFSCIVLAVNYCCQTISTAGKAGQWTLAFKDLITYIEIGHKFGMRVPSVSAEGGALMGFAACMPGLVFKAENPSAAREVALHTNAKDFADAEIAQFGCQRYQIGAFILQTLGFGASAALGVALALGRFHSQVINLEGDEEAKRWKAALLWIEALKEGRNFPADMAMRSHFPEVMPAKDGQSKNTSLEVLYTEVAKVRSQGSQWMWHLPKEYLKP